MTEPKPEDYNGTEQRPALAGPPQPSGADDLDVLRADNNQLKAKVESLEEQLKSADPIRNVESRRSCAAIICGTGVGLILIVLVIDMFCGVRSSDLPDTSHEYYGLLVLTIAHSAFVFGLVLIAFQLSRLAQSFLLPIAQYVIVESKRAESRSKSSDSELQGTLATVTDLLQTVVESLASVAGAKRGN